MTTDSERLATLEEQVRGLREDVAGMRDQEDRTRKRLHDLEGLARMLVDQEKQRRRAAQNQDRRLQRRISIAAVLLSVAVFVEPIVARIAFG